ncbi:MAG: DUF2167 domain-containing protein [Polyangiaceae bacterium]
MSRPSLAPALLSLITLLAALATVTSASAAPKAPHAKPAPTSAATSSAMSSSPASSDTAAADAEPPLPWKEGPQVIDLGHGATMALPEGRRFLGMPEAAKVMKKLGNLNTESLLGIAVSAADDADYLVSVRYEDEGFIKDDESIDSKAILESIRSGETEYNEERKRQGFPPIHADGWSEEPRYDKQAHELVWALLVSADGKPSVNLNTRVLGRKGYVAVNLIAAPDDLPRYRDDGIAFVRATTFDKGSRYEDFNKSTDKVAEYGLAGLILGGVGLGVVKAAKVGVLAAFWKPILAFLLAAKKAVLVGIAAIVGYFRKLFSRREKAAPPAV